jgi:hypothetical protein
VSSAAWPASQVIRIYTSTVIAPAITFSAAVGGGTSDARLQGTVTTLAALLRVENDQSVQRAILYAALSAHPPVLAPQELSSLQQAYARRQPTWPPSTLPRTWPTSSSSRTPWPARRWTARAAQETRAEYQAAASPSAPPTRNPGLDAATWYGDMTTTIGDTRKVADQLAGQITGQANTLKSNAAKTLLLTSTAVLALLLVLLISAVLARPLRKQHADTPVAVTR